MINTSIKTLSMTAGELNLNTFFQSSYCSLDIPSPFSERFSGTSPKPGIMNLFPLTVLCKRLFGPSQIG